MGTHGLCFLCNFLQLWGSRKCPYFPHGRDWKFLGVGRDSKFKHFKKMHDA